MSTTPLRLLLVSLHTSPLAVPGGADAGGMNVVVLEQARALAAAGHQVDIVTRRSDPDAPAIRSVAPRLRQVLLHGGPATPLAKSAMEQAIEPFSADLERLVSDAEQAGEPYSLIHSHHWFSGVAALPVAHRHQLPHLQSFHSVAAPEGSTTLGAGEPAESAGRIPGERRTARESQLVIAVSQAEARTVRERYGVPSDRVLVVPPGVDTARFRPSPLSPQERLEEPTMLFAARLQPLKAPDLALDVLARLDESCRARLVLVGAASEDFAAYRAELEESARSLGLADRVAFAGSMDQDELAARMREAAVLLLPSWSETFGLVALEAQSSGTPVVAWDRAGGVQEAVGPGSRLIAGRDPDVWAEAVESLIGEEAAFQEASRAVRAFAETRTWQACAHHLERIYRAVVHGGAAHGPSDPWHLVRTAGTVLAVHAHPDDESLATGALLADLSARGTRVVVVTATRGEEGEVVPGAIPEDDERPLEEVRAQEVRRALGALGIDEHHMLGEAPALAEGAAPRRYRDSGMRWVREGVAGPSETAGPTSFTHQDLDQEIADLSALIAHVRPDVVLGYDDQGTYGHPDHLRAHEATAGAACAQGVPFVEVASEPDPEAAADGEPFAFRDQPGSASALAAALRAYRTQLTVIGDLEGVPGGVRVRHVGGQLQDVPLRTGLRITAGRD
ncbi:glycosyltransferase [Brachybacterium sp. ACRRE]|uniref:glycosyltransferase n=1 Tax=Brachybacterium sp. ACRRE TaxID=2918184 RepID=UPI001EF2A4C7|nr:glycosyltransferase [Brachybacterium sp. ACRRE]MCG7308766.1 glycosyltransferase [Brachybacterium sp. ACRRE]